MHFEGGGLCTSKHPHWVLRDLSQHKILGSTRKSSQAPLYNASSKSSMILLQAPSSAGRRNICTETWENKLCNQSNNYGFVVAGCPIAHIAQLKEKALK